MIGCTKLLCGTVKESDVLRYGRETEKLPAHMLQFAMDKRPIVVWNMSYRCNLKCVHCYIHAEGRRREGELTTDEARAFIDDLAAYKAPVLLFSGGEPLMREDLMDLGSYAVSKGLRTVISTNGTLITEDKARRIGEEGFSYVGISLDGLEETNDRFRCQQGAFRKALEGIRNCTKAGVKTGLRFTINRRNHLDLPGVFDLIEKEEIPRVCFYHLVYAGRGTQMRQDALTHAEERAAVDLIFAKTVEFCRRGLPQEILTVDNHTDGVYLYLKLRRDDPARADEVHRLLLYNGGNSTGIGIADVDPLGNVHADQFWQHYSFGNIRERPFSEIWEDRSDPLMAGLKDRSHLLKGKCGRCPHVNICNGNFRVRAEAVHGDVWAEDPACYLEEEELATGVLKS
jgi:12,18-didecarboxysiroheme deacetylase